MANRRAGAAQTDREIRVLIADSVRRALGEGVTPAVLALADRGEFPRDLWRLVRDLGLDQVLIAGNESSPLPATGPASPTPWRQAEPIVRACGEFAAPLPLPEALLGRWLLAQAGLPQPEGLVTVAPGPLETGSATLVRVPWGRVADWVVVTAGGKLRLVPGPEVAWTAGTSVAGEPRDTGLLDPGLLDPASGRDWMPLHLPPGALRYLGGLLRATQTAGAAGTLVRLASTYVVQREQFGRPLARFQVIQHQLARLAEAAAAVDAVTAAAWQALETIGFRGGSRQASSRDARLLMAAAKATAGSLTDTLAGVAHQVHGAMGFTAEHSLHHYTRRLWAWRAEFGGPAAWHEELGALALGRGGEKIWADLTAVMDRT